MTTFCCLRFYHSQPGRPGPRIYIPHEKGGPVIPPGTGFPFRCLLRLAGLWWRYSNPPPRGDTHSSLLRILPESRYIASTPMAQETSFYFCYVFTESLHSNGRDADRREFIVVLTVAQQPPINTRTSIVAYVSRFLCFNSSRTGQIRHNTKDC
jgi:hypothetical protein